MVMYAGQVIEDGPVIDVFSAPRHPYTEALLSATVEPEHRGHELPMIPGAPPDPRHLPPGCPFGPRCRYVSADCRTEVPPLQSISDARRVRCIHHNLLELSGARR
jgi:oligopeptide/dipeptide ABC transporter ATP-binding protein